MGALRLVAVLAFGFAVGLAAAAFFAAGAFLVAAALVGVGFAVSFVVSFFGLPTGAFFGAVAFVVVGEDFYQARQHTIKASALDDDYLCRLLRLRSRRRGLYTRLFLVQLHRPRSTY